jgi:beta-lactamase regulating signal transducer with metallopeptidase domain
VLCILYVNLVGACLGVVALLVERAMPALAMRRWLWLAVIGLSMFVPGYYRTHHSWSLLDGSVNGTAGHAAFSLVDLQWWAETDSYGPIINRIWLSLSAILIAWALANAWRVWQVIASSRSRDGDNSAAMIDGIPVVVTEEVGPATVGLLRTQVLLPRWALALPQSQRQYVLRHENEHRRAHDGLLLFIASLPLVLAPWNLALWWQLRRLSLAVEMDCDARVVDALGDAHTYGALLLTVAEAGSRSPHLQPAFLGSGMLERRLTQLLAPQRLSRVQRLVVPALAIALLTLVASMPHPVSGLPSQHHPTTSASARPEHP